MNFELSQNQRRFFFVLLAIFFVLRLVMAAQVPLTDTTESRYAEISRKMIETENWLTPQYDYGVPFWAKPPLSMWVSAAGMKVFGVNEFGARIFIILTAGALTILIYRWIARWRGRDVALVASVALVGMPAYFISAGMVMTDFVMLFGISLSMIAFWEAVESENPKTYWGYLFFVGLAIGMMSKGPVAVVLCALPIFLWTLWQKKWLVIWQRLPWIKGGILGLALTLPWYLMAEKATPGFLEYFIVGEHFKRFLVSGWKGDLYGNAHSEPLGTIWLYWLLVTLPWGLLLIPVLFKKGRERLKKFVPTLPAGWLPYLLCWLLGPLLFFSVARNVIPSYVLSGIPASAIFIIEIWALSRNAEKSHSARFFPLKAATLTSLALFLVVFGLFTIDFAKAPKTSAKKILAQVESRVQAEALPARLYLYQQRVYSAEFYAGGDVHSIPDEASLQAILLNNENNYVLAKTIQYERLSSPLAAQLEEIAKDGKWRAYHKISAPNTKNFPVNNPLKK